MNCRDALLDSEESKRRLEQSTSHLAVGFLRRLDAESTPNGHDAREPTRDHHECDDGQERAKAIDPEPITEQRHRQRAERDPDAHLIEGFP